jgi:myo-inositol-1(or 4)-monophosphatase
VFWHKKLNYWDIAAGIIIVKEAGGTITDYKGKEFKNTNKELLPQIQELTKKRQKFYHLLHDKICFFSFSRCCCI